MKVKPLKNDRSGTTALVLASFFLASVAHAGDSSSPSTPAATPSASPSNFTCTEEALKDPANANNYQQMQYCKAAIDARKAADTNGTLWKIYAGVTGICTTSCVASTYTASYAETMSFICLGSSAAAGVTDGLMTKNYMTAAMSVATAGAGVAFRTGALSSLGLTPATGTDPHTDVGSCISAVVSAIQTYSKKSAEDDARDTDKQNEAIAKQLAAQNTITYNSTPGLNPITASSSSATNISSNSGTSNSGTSGTPGSAAATTTSAACGNVTNLSGAAQCAAMAGDSDLAKKLSDPRFGNDFKKLAGMSFDDYLKNSKAMSPANAMGLAMNSALTPGAMSTMQSALAGFANQKADLNRNSSATYVAGAKPQGNSTVGFDNPFLNLNANNANTANAAVRTTSFGPVAPRRNLASVSAEDSTVSLFDRITFRYGSVAPRLVLDVKSQSLQAWPDQVGK